VTSALCIRPHL